MEESAIFKHLEELPEASVEKNNDVSTTFISENTTCLDCGKIFKQGSKRASWNFHNRKHIAEKFQCECDKTHKSWQSKERHMRLSHGGWVVKYANM